MSATLKKLLKKTVLTNVRDKSGKILVDGPKLSLSKISLILIRSASQTFKVTAFSRNRYGHELIWKFGRREYDVRVDITPGTTLVQNSILTTWGKQTSGKCVRWV